MNKIISLLLLACLLLNVQLAFAEEAEDQSESGDESEISYDSNMSQQPGSFEEVTIMGKPLADRAFYITVTSARDLVKSGMSAISAIGWFFGGLRNAKQQILGFLNISPPKVPDILFKMKVIEIKLNQNYENAVDFKNSVTKKRPAAETSILISRRGFYCDEEFCEQAGEEKYGMGICTPYYCECDREVPKPRRCKNLYEAFDPVYKSCNDAFKVKICGF